jgi:hypothetical protein
MAIRRTHDDPKALLGLAEAAGIAEAQIRQDDQAFKLAQQLQERRDRIELAGINAELRKQTTANQMKMQYDQILMKQAHDFEIRETLRAQKIMDEEQKRQRKQAEFDNLAETIQNDERLSEDEKARFISNARSRHTFGAGAPQFDIVSDIDMARHQRAQEAAARAEEASARAQEAHEARMTKGPSFAEKRAAEKFITEHPDPRWWKPFDQLSSEEKMLKLEAQSILAPAQNVLNIPQVQAPDSYDEFEALIAELKAVDPVKARQYYDQNIGKYR